MRTGNFAYFDTANERLDARHVMASGALPPGFPPIEIDGEYYWDGGLVSNTPLQYVLDQPGTKRRVAFQVDLFPARGELPRTLPEVDEREKDIRFSSRTRMNTTIEVQQQAIAQAARRLVAKLPPRLRDDPDALALAALRCEAEVAVVHLIYRSKHYESHSKDYEFSRRSMLEHWESGRADTTRTLHDPRWVDRPRQATGVHVYDLASPSPSEKTATVDKAAHARTSQSAQARRIGVVTPVGPRRARPDAKRRSDDIPSSPFVDRNPHETQGQGLHRHRRRQRHRQGDRASPMRVKAPRSSSPT